MQTLTSGSASGEPSLSPSLRIYLLGWWSVRILALFVIGYTFIRFFFAPVCPRQGTSPLSYVFFQGSQLLIQSHLVCPERKCPLLSVGRDRWELPGPCGLCYQLFCGIDDFQDFCGDVAERNSRILLFGPITEGDRRQEQHINNDMEVLHDHGARHETDPIITHRNVDVPKEQEA